MTDTVHKFELHQAVRLKGSGAFNGQASRDGVYEVTRLMPEDRGGEFHYRLKSSAGERVAREGDLELVANEDATSVFGSGLY